MDEAGSTSRDEPPRGPKQGVADAARLEISDPGGLLPARERVWVAERGREALRAMGAAGEVRVRLVADEEMAAAHERFSNVPGTTDVLTFNYGADGDEELDVDVLVCVDEARRQGETRGHGAEREVLLYFVHAVLHCLGYDDHGEADARAMHEREDEILNAIGVGAVYGANERAGGGAEAGA